MYVCRVSLEGSGPGLQVGVLHTALLETGRNSSAAPNEVKRRRGEKALLQILPFVFRRQPAVESLPRSPDGDETDESSQTNKKKLSQNERQ